MAALKTVFVAVRPFKRLSGRHVFSPSFYVKIGLRFQEELFCYCLALETYSALQCTEVSFASFLSGGFTTMAERKLAKCTSVQCTVKSYLVRTK